MKYLAIFKDSLREAIDAKLLYVTVGLSLLVSLVVITMTLTPVPVDEAGGTVLGFFNMMLARNREESKKMGLGDVEHLETGEFKRLNAGTEPWTGDYQFTLTARLWAEPDDTKGKPAVQALETATSMMIMPWSQTIRVKELDMPDKKTARYTVTTSGTKNKFKTREEWIHQPGLFFGLLPLPIKFLSLRDLVSLICNEVVARFGAAVTMLLSCILTAFFIPNMLARGTVDLLLVKPINRVTLFIYKFLGGMTFMVLNTTVIMVGIWLGVGIQAGLWLNSFLLCIAIFTFQFAIFYAVSVLAGVLTRSPLVSILSVAILWGLLTFSGYVYWFVIERPQVQEAGSQVIAAAEPGWATYAIEAIHAPLPRYKEIDWLTSKSIQSDLILASGDASPAMAQYRDYQLKELDKSSGSYTWTASLGISALFIAVMVSLAAAWFATRNY